jgi:dihydropteroate synthase
MFTLNCKGRLLNMDTPIVMGIININNESFYSGSRHTETTAILRTAAQMLKEGATILDIGGQSTRPGSTTYSVDEELQRVLPAIEVLHKEFPQAILSIDTFYAKVAREAAAAGASIINDISAGSMDSELIDTVAALQLPYVLMHMQGTPQNMQQNPQYENVVREVLDFFIEKLALLRSKGIKDIIIDPGFGFGKTTLHNFCLLKYLSTFEMLQCPLLLGVSRKGMIYHTLGITPEEALNGTTVINTIGLLNGAQILRVHDVKAAVEAIKLYTTYKEASV